MNDQLPPDRLPADSPANSVSTAYVAIVGGLLIVIIMALAFLWWTERSARRASEAAANARIAAMKAEQAKRMDFMFAGAKLVAPAAPEESQPRQVNLDGQTRQAKLLDPQAATRLGFAPGDLILVPASTTQPATAP